jgi:hypothetical protein
VLKERGFQGVCAKYMFSGVFVPILHSHFINTANLLFVIRILKRYPARTLE